MGEFKPIETQEQLNAVIADRLEKERQRVEAKYPGYDEYKDKAGKYDELAGKDYEKQIKTLTDDLTKARDELAEKAEKFSELEGRATAAELKNLKTRVALTNGIPVELAERLAGSNEEELTADAETWKKFMPKGHMPGKSSEAGAPSNDRDAMLKSVLEKLRKE